MNGRAAVRLVLCALYALGVGGCVTDAETGLPDELPAGTAAPPAPARDGAPPYRADLMQIPDAVPRSEPLTEAGNKSPYEVLGTTYTLQRLISGQRSRGLGSWYGTKFDRQKTSLGEDYDVYAMTAAHKTLPIPCYLRVTNLENGQHVVVRVNDRGPFHSDRIIDLSYAAAYRLGYADKGTAMLELEVLDPMAPEWVARRAGTEAPHTVAVAASAPGADVATRQTWVQAGAFRSLETARQLQQSLAAQFGADEVALQSGAGWHRVRIGPLIDTAALESARRRLAAARLGTQVVTE